MSSFLALQTSICWRDGYDVEGYVTSFFYFMPVVLWWSLSGFAFYTRDLYLQLLSSSYWITAFASVVIQNLAQQFHPNPLCNTVVKFALPAWEAQLVAHYLTIIVVHRVYWRIPFGLFSVLRGVFLGVVLPAVLVASGNYSAEQVLIGMTVGCLTGLFCSQSIYLFWLPRLSVVQYSTLLRSWFGFHDSMSAFYLKLDDSIVEDRKQLPRPSRSPADEEGTVLLGSFMSPMAWRDQYSIRGNDSRAYKLFF